MIAPIPPEVTALAVAGVLQLVQFAMFAVAINLSLGLRYTTGARDTPPPREISPIAGRLKRALNNHFEALIMFTLAVVVVTLSGASTPLTEACAWTYVVARVLYIPTYAFALNPWRTIMWCIGFAATMTMIGAVLW